MFTEMFPELEKARLCLDHINKAWVEMQGFMAKAEEAGYQGPWPIPGEQTSLHGDFTILTKELAKSMKAINQQGQAIEMLILALAKMHGIGQIEEGYSVLDRVRDVKAILIRAGLEMPKHFNLALLKNTLERL